MNDYRLLFLFFNGGAKRRDSDRKWDCHER